jgi:hypothetical protein
MRQIDVGIRIDEGLTFVGIEEVNEIIKNGGRIVSVEAGEALIEAVDEDSVFVDGDETFALAGCTIRLNIEN